MLYVPLKLTVGVREHVRHIFSLYETIHTNTKNIYMNGKHQAMYKINWIRM